MTRLPIASLIALLAWPACAQAQDAPAFDPVFTDHAVLQRDRPIALWGEAEPGARLELALDGETVSTQADGHGRWRAELAARAAGGPYTLTLRETGGGATELSDILIGDLWLCSGQSNMEFPVSRALNPGREIPAATQARIRLFDMPKASTAAPLVNAHVFGRSSRRP